MFFAFRSRGHGAAGIVRGRGGKWICMGAIYWLDGRRGALRVGGDRGRVNPLSAPFAVASLARMRRGRANEGWVRGAVPPSFAWARGGGNCPQAWHEVDLRGCDILLGWAQGRAMGGK
jgi:hypothetical protein